LVRPGERFEDSSDLPFRLLVQNVRDYAIFMLDPEGHIVSWNEGARRIKGYSASEILGKHVSVFYPPREVARGKPAYELKEAAAEGRFEDEGWRVRQDGSRFWASVAITALRDDSGHLVGFAKVTGDLSQRKQAEDEQARLLARERAARFEAEATAQRLAAIQQVTDAALAHLPLDDLLTTLLARIVELMGVDTAAVLLLDPERKELVATAAKGLEEEVEREVRIPLGKGFAGRIAQEGRPVIIEDIDRADIVNPILREKGLRSLLGAPLTVAGSVLGVLHVGTLQSRQFTERDVELLQLVADRVALAVVDQARLYEAEHAARVAAEAAVRLRDDFLAAAAHELKTPITALHVHIQILLRLLDGTKSLEPGDLRRRLQTVDQQVRKLTRLISQLLDVARIEGSQLVLERTITDVTAVVTNAAANAAVQTERHTIRVQAPGPVTASVDSLRLEQVLTNLIDNAVRYSPEGGPIDVEVALSDPETVRITVTDRGIGVPAEHRPHIFERFYQANTRYHAGGMGLGLYISHEIVERHGGQLYAEYPPEGGTRFVLDLPTGLQPGSHPTTDAPH
jgi:PAS domain S-box-containing protein